MGYGAYEHSAYTAKTSLRAARGYKTAFEHHEDIQAGRTAVGCHELMNIFGKIRESRDSEQHPNSRGVYVGFDGTGSMRDVPVTFQKSLSPLMSMLTANDYISDPQVLVSVYGDAFVDKVPLQVGQFESDVNIDADLSRLYLEGGGGYGMEESSELMAYALAHRCSMDCFEKRQERGYAFLFGDELSYDTLFAAQIEKHFGKPPGANEQFKFEDLDVQELFQLARQKFDVFFVIPHGTAYYNDARVLKHWQMRVGENRALKLSDATAVSGLIASAIAFAEGCTHDEIREHLGSSSLPGGAFKKSQIDSVIEALGPMGAQTEQARTRREGRRRIIRHPASTSTPAST